jgi:hypothetical protein
LFTGIFHLQEKNMNWLGIIATVAGMLAGVWFIFRYVITVTVRLDARTFKTIYELLKTSRRRFILTEEFITESKYPIEYKAFVWMKGSPWFYIDHGERLLQAGWHGKDSVTTLTVFRWSYSRAKVYLDKKVKELQRELLGVPVEVITPHYIDMIGLIKTEPPKPALNPKLWEDIEVDAASVFNGEKLRSGALLYGPPGNNKTYFVKYLATKYKVPIKIITFTPDFSNFDIMLIFSQITGPCIVLFEDFDNYFHGRKCVLGSDNKSIKFTFDVVLNGLDGVYNTYEKAFFVMTVNDITKVDTALKNRPSRFKFLREFACPELETRCKLLPKEWSENTEGMNLDQIFRLKEFYEQGLSLFEAKNNLGMADKVTATEKLAHELYKERIKNGLAGDNDGDWFEAEKRLGIQG